MTEKTIERVLPDIKPWSNNYGTFYGITAFFTDGDTLMVSKKKPEWANELMAILVDIVDEPMDFHLEDKGVSEAGSQKWNVKGIANIEGTVIYGKMADGAEAPGVQGSQADGKSPTDGRKSDYPRGCSPEHNDDIAKAVALKAAVQVGFVGGAADVLKIADEFYAWLRASEPALSAYPSSGTVTPVVEPQAGAGSEEPSPVTPVGPVGGAAVAGDERGEGVGEATVAQALGEGTPAPTPHEHDWQPHPNLRGKLKCECGAMRSKAGFEGQV